MKKIAAILLLILIPLFHCYSQNTPVIETGSLLSIQPVEPCIVYLDGEEIGAAPLLISDLSEKSKLIQLMGKNRYAEVKISYNPLKSVISYYKPDLGEYYGTIAVDSNVDETLLFIDGKTVSDPEQWFIRVAAGTHTVSMKRSGYLEESADIDVPRLKTVNVRLNLKPAVKVTFSEKIPEGSRIIFRQAEKELNFIAGEETDIRLSGGSWECRIDNILFESIIKTVKVGSDPVTIDLSFNYFSPQVNITEIAENSTIFFEDRDVTASIENGLLDIPIGTGELLILNEKYLPFYAEIQADDGNTIVITPEYKPDPEYIRSGNITIGTILAGTGATLLTGGLLLSNNDFLAKNSVDYNAYSTLKYSSIGTGAVGILLLLGGGLFGGISAFSE